MTIIQPSLKFKLNLYTFLVMFAILLMGGYYVFEYNNLVILRHEIIKAEARMLLLQNAESDLKNRLYSMLDPNYLENYALENGLTIEKKPEYLRLGKTTTALSGSDLTFRSSNAVGIDN